MLRMALLPLMVLQGRFEEMVYTFPSLFSKTCQATSSLLKEGLEVRNNYVDFQGATQLDLKDVIAVDLQLSEHPLICVQVLLPSLHKIPSEGFVHYYLCTLLSSSRIYCYFFYHSLLFLNFYDHIVLIKHVVLLHNLSLACGVITTLCFLII